MTTALWIAAVLLVVIGIAGTVLPALPGTLFVFAGLLLGAWIDAFSRVSLVTIVLLGGLTLLSFAVDLGAAALGAKRVGASRHAIIGAAAGTLLGLPFGIIGIVFGPFVGAVAGEWIARRDTVNAGRVGIATWLGFLIGTALKIVLAFVMVGLFALAYFL